MASASAGLVWDTTPNVKIEENPMRQTSKRLKPRWVFIFGRSCRERERREKWVVMRWCRRNGFKGLERHWMLKTEDDGEGREKGERGGERGLIRVE